MSGLRASAQLLRDRLAVLLQSELDEQCQGTPEQDEIAELRDEIEEYRVAIRDYQQKIEAREAKIKELESGAELRRRKQQEADDKIQQALSGFTREFAETRRVLTASGPSSQPAATGTQPPIERDTTASSGANEQGGASRKRNNAAAGATPSRQARVDATDNDAEPARPRRNRAQPVRFQDTLVGDDFRRAMEEHDAELSRGRVQPLAEAAARSERSQDAQETEPASRTPGKRSRMNTTTDHGRSPRKRQRITRTDRTISFEDVFQDGRPKERYYMVQTNPPEEPPRWYILRCDIHGIHYREQGALQRASRHVAGKDHCNTMGTTQYHAIRELGIEVLGCNSRLAEKNNNMCRQAERAGPAPLPRTARQQARFERHRPPPGTATGLNEAAARAGRPGGPRNRGVTPFDGDPVTGRVYLLYYNRTKTWYTGIRMPPGCFKVVGISGKFASSGLQRFIPRCYEQTEGGKILKWTESYRDGGPKASERIFPVLYFDDQMEVPLRGKFRLPKRNVLAWLARKHFREFDVNDEFSRKARGYQTARRFIERLAALQETGRHHGQGDRTGGGGGDDDDDARSQAGDDSDDSSDESSAGGHIDDENDNVGGNASRNNDQNDTTLENDEAVSQFEQDPLMHIDFDSDSDGDVRDPYLPPLSSSESERGSMPRPPSRVQHDQSDGEDTGNTRPEPRAVEPVDSPPVSTSDGPTDILRVDGTPLGATGSGQQVVSNRQSPQAPPSTANTARAASSRDGDMERPGNTSSSNTAPPEERLSDNATGEKSTAPIPGPKHPDGIAAQQIGGEHRNGTPSPWDLAEAALTAVSGQNLPPGPRQQADADSNYEDQPRRPPPPVASELMGRQGSAPGAGFPTPTGQAPSTEHVLSHGPPSSNPYALSPKPNGNQFTSANLDRFQAVRLTRVPAASTTSTTTREGWNDMDPCHRPTATHNIPMFSGPARPADPPAGVSQPNYSTTNQSPPPALATTATTPAPASVQTPAQSASGTTSNTADAPGQDLTHLFWRTARWQKEQSAAQSTPVSIPTSQAPQGNPARPLPRSPSAPDGHRRKSSIDFLVRPSPATSDVSGHPLSSGAQAWPFGPPAIPQNHPAEDVGLEGLQQPPIESLPPKFNPPTAIYSTGPRARPSLSMNARPPPATSAGAVPVQPQATPNGPQPAPCRSPRPTGADPAPKSPCAWCIYIGKSAQCHGRNPPCRECRRHGHECVKSKQPETQSQLDDIPPAVPQPAVHSEVEDDTDVAVGDPESWNRSYLRKMFPMIGSESPQM